jgi:tRNA uridine 5-carboxymethylaminomethyl modification enzyme
MATEVLIEKNDNIKGVRTFLNMDSYAPYVVLTTGTFMSGKIWVGRTSAPHHELITKQLDFFGLEA